MGTKSSTARFIKLDGKGKRLPESAPDWAVTLEVRHANGDPRRKPIPWDPNALGPFTAAKQDETLAKHRIAGGAAVAPALVDLRELAPITPGQIAEFEKFFRGERCAWYRSAEKAPDPGCRWGVYFDDGGSLYLHDGSAHFVRAVRSSQSFGSRRSSSGRKS